MPVLLRKLLIGSGVALCAAVVGQNAVAGFGDDLHWQSVIGIAQPNNVVGSGTGAVTGGGAPWSAFDGHVNVDLERQSSGRAARRVGARSGIVCRLTRAAGGALSQALGIALR